MFDWLEDLFGGGSNKKATMYYYKNGREAGTKLQNGTYYSKDGKTYYTFKNGKVVKQGKVGNITDVINNITNGIYNTVNKAQEQALQQKVSNAVNSGGYSSGGGGGYAPATYSSGGGGGSYRDSVIDSLLQRIEELEHPKVYTAAEIADIYGLTDQYNEQNILNEYNEATNKYYNDMITEQNKLRTQYARNNAQYLNQITDSYLDSYKNSAPTATGKGTLAANYLSTMINADNQNSANDLGMLQSVNTLDEARKAELEQNKATAKQYYNQMGAYLSGLSTQLNASDVKQYVDSLDAYSQMYSASRNYQASLAQANAAKYAGLAQASGINASAAANRFNSSAASAFQDLWNFYNGIGGGQYASNKVSSYLNGTSGNFK